jgi:hypothetical protein
VFGVWGAFPIILALLLYLPFAIHGGYRSYFVNSYKRDLQSQPIEITLTNVEVVVTTETMINFTIHIENLPETLTEFYLIAKLGPADTEFVAAGIDLTTIIAKREAAGWTFLDTNRRQQTVVLPSPNEITISVPKFRYRLYPATSRQNFKIFLGTRHMNWNVPIKTFSFPVNLPE